MRKVIAFILTLIFVLSIAGITTFADNSYEYGQIISFNESANTAVSFDTFLVNGEVKVDGGASLWIDENLTDRAVNGEDGSVSSIGIRGWAGFNLPIVQFGYSINNHAPVFGDFSQPTGDDVKAAGGEYAERFFITVPTEGLAGNNTIAAIVKLADGTLVKLDAQNANTEISFIGIPLQNPGTDDTVIRMVFSSTIVFVIAAFVVNMVVKKKESM